LELWHRSMDTSLRTEENKKRKKRKSAQLAKTGP